jgi:uncharacterized protein YbjT (DUF2867 family)
MTRIAMIGATGLVGSQLRPLLESKHKLLVLGRRPSGAAGEKIGSMAEWPALLAGERVDVAMSTLGTTRKAAGSWDAFMAVDRDAVLAFAKAAHACGARHFLAVSSSGANPASRNAYLQLKGEVEDALAAVGFDRVDILRPGLLLGKRSGKPRLLEKVAVIADPISRIFLRGSWDRYAGINAAVVARAMAALVERHEPGLFRHHNREIRALAGA